MKKNKWCDGVMYSEICKKVCMIINDLKNKTYLLYLSIELQLVYFNKQQ